jgi:thimet oligopeptidase
MDLSWTQWTPEQIEAVATAALAHKRAGLDAVLAVPDDQRTFANTIAALERSSDTISDVQQQLELLLNVHPDAMVRDAAQRSVDCIEAALVDMEYDRRLWAAVQAWEATHEQLDPIDRKLADDTLRDMRRMGFALSDADFAELKRTITELRKLETEFEKTINDWSDRIEVTREQLSGLPERYIEGLKRSGDNYLVTLEYPDLFPFMRQADDDGARRELATKNLRKGGPENLERLAQMIRLRQRHAQLLGYATHADFQCEPRMAKTAEAVKTFLDDIAGKLIPAARKELIDLIDIKKRTLGLEKRAPVHFHELAYWSYKLLKERYDIDGDVVKEYFPLARVLDGMMSIYQGIFGVTFTPVSSASLWHPDARLYEVRDSERVIGHFILDLHPRQGKYGHAAAFSPILERTNASNERIAGLVALVCNFPKPTLSNPSLLTHDEVETLFHEFGHICHALLSGGRWQHQNGLYVAMDFVETPSQLLEEWPWHPQVIQRIGAHYKTGEPMPRELQEKLIASRHHMDARYYLDQAVKALYDLRMHAQPTDTMIEPTHMAQWYHDMALQYEAVDLPDDAIIAAGWGHMASYDAGYYSYLWSKVYALDMYTRFATDPLDPTIGKEYRTNVLEPGASKPEMDIVTGFLGHAPSNAAFLKALGIDTLS